jgi:hypothetical protein
LKALGNLGDGGIGTLDWKNLGLLEKVILAAAIMLPLVVLMPKNNSAENNQDTQEVLVLEGYEEYQEQLDWLNENLRGDWFCKLEIKVGDRRTSVGIWQPVAQSEPCFTLTEDFDNKQFSGQELESASNWYMEFLLDQVFDSSILDNPEGLSSWLESEAPEFFTDEVLALVAENPNDEFEVDGRIVQSNEMIATWGKADSNFYAFTRDGGPRILAIKGGLDADFHSVGKNQVDMTGSFSIYYRVDKDTYVESLIEKENWTLVALKEQHPELFDTSPIAVRIDARVGHTLEKAESDNWLITRWKSPSYSFRVGFSVFGD